jgi:hypothetical protein
MFQIIRYHQDSDIESIVLKTVGTLEQAQEHCNDPETSSRTCTSRQATTYTEHNGPWFDGYREV